RLFLLVAAAAALAAPAGALASNANGNHDAYVWIIGATTPGDSAMAADGSTIELSGRGTLQAGPGHTASGGGTYSLSSGGSGTWTVTGMQGFVSYGSAGPDFPPGFTGGEAKLAISLSNGDSGVLTIICELGSAPAGKMEGFTVVLGKGGAFSHEG